MPYIVNTDTALATALGVTRQAVSKAERRGRIRRRHDGAWDVLEVLDLWRENTWWGLQRPQCAPEFRPWLDRYVPLRETIVREVVRRALAAGAYEVDER
jgi:hypothetical protein